MAGNCAVLKPSEVSPNCESLIAQLIPKYLDSNCIEVICGAIETTSNLLGKMSHILNLLLLKG